MNPMTCAYRDTRKVSMCLMVDALQCSNSRTNATSHGTPRILKATVSE